jgi:hypothetical protein
MFADGFRDLMKLRGLTLKCTTPPSTCKKTTSDGDGCLVALHHRN